MSRAESMLMTLSTVLTGGTGIGLFVVKHWVRTDDPYAVINHPLQPVLLKAHLIAVPFAIFAFGVVFSGHLMEKVRSGRRAGWRSGLGAAVFFAPLVASGVLIQVLSHEGSLAAAAWTHAALGTAYLIAYAAHWRVTLEPARRLRFNGGRAERPTDRLRRPRFPPPPHGTGGVGSGLGKQRSRPPQAASPEG